MAKFLTTAGVTYHQEELFKNAKKQIIIISPYLKLSRNMFERIKAAKDRGVEIIICYGKTELDDKTFKEVQLLGKLYFYEEMHAKCYISENELIIGSMNLYEASEKNREMAVFGTIYDDKKMYEDAKGEALLIIENAQPVSGSLQPKTTDFITKSSIPKQGSLFGDDLPFANNSLDRKKGHCLRCGMPIDFNPSKPLCYYCYEEWDEYGNPFYKEDFCHGCGNMYRTSYAEPLCKRCERIL